MFSLYFLFSCFYHSFLRQKINEKNLRFSTVSNHLEKGHIRLLTCNSKTKARKKWTLEQNKRLCFLTMNWFLFSRIRQFSLMHGCFYCVLFIFCSMKEFLFLEVGAGKECHWNREVGTVKSFRLKLCKASWNILWNFLVLNWNFFLRFLAYQLYE